MASLLPSEVARLVLGYLEDNGCQKSSERLLQELDELSECVKLRRKGRTVATRIGNQTLQEMLMDYSAAKDLVMESVRNNSSTLSSVPSSGSLLSQIKALISIVLDNKYLIKQHKPSIGTVSRVKQQTRMMKLQKELKHRSPRQQEDTVNASSPESLCDPHHQDTDCLEHHTHHDARQDSLGGDSTFTSLTHDLDMTHQRRKGIVKRRSHGCEQTPVKMSPIMDNDANFEKILKNLYENTALHEKIAESINRGLSTQCKAGPSTPSHGEDDGDNSVSPCNRKGKDTAITYSAAEGRERNFVSVEEPAGSNGGGDVSFLKEFDHIVTGIVSEAASDPVFENLIDEVFGDGPATSNHGNAQDHFNEPPMLLSIPPTTTPSSHSILHIPHSFPLHPPSISPNMCHQPPSHSLSTPHNRMSPVNDTPPHLTSPRLHVPSFTSPHPPSTACKLLPESSPKKVEDVWSTRSLPHEDSEGYKGVKTQSSDILRDALQESLLLVTTSPNTTRDPSPNSRTEAGECSLTKQTESSPLNESCEKNTTTPPSPTARHKANKRKKNKQNVKRGKEGEKNLGEQLLKEFVDFQSARPDKICVQDKTDKCEVPDGTSLQSLGLPIEEGRTKHQESSNEVEKKLNEESVLTTESKQETASPSPQNTDKSQPPESSADAGTTITDEHIDRSSLEAERRFQSNAEPKSVPLSSESLPVTPYTNDTNKNKTEQEAEHENKRRAIIINSSPTWSVRSNTIPGLQPSKAASEEDTYTITQLAPVKPLDLTSLVSSLCETEEPDINYSNSTQINSFTNIWEPSTDVTPLSHVQGGTEGLDKEGYTIILPTVSSKKEADEQFLALFNENQITSSQEFTTSASLNDTTHQLFTKGTKKSNERVDGQLVTTYSLPNSVTISLPDLSVQNMEQKLPKKNQRKSTSKKKETSKKSVAKKPKESTKKTKTTNQKNGRVVDVCGVKKRKRKRQSIGNHEEVQEDMSNNIITTALSFALNSVTPRKNDGLSADTSVGETYHVSVMDVDHETADLLGVNTTNNNSNPGVGDSINKSCEDKEQKQRVKSDTETTTTTKQTSTKHNSGRSPQLKALLQLSKSMSPAKRALAWKNVSQSEESPHIRVLHTRGSQSTPSHKNSHIRVLDFGTPQKRILFGRSPRRAVANLKFSPPQGKKSPKKSNKISRLLSKKFIEHSLATSKTLDKVVEESVSELVETQTALSEQKNKKSRESLARGSCESSKLKHERSDHKNSTEKETSRSNSMSEADFALDTRQPFLLMTEDEDSIILHLDGEDSTSSSSPLTDSGSIELFDLSKEQDNGHQDYNFNTNFKDLNPDYEDELPDLTLPLPPSTMTEHSSGARIKQMQTPSKAPHTSSSCVPITPMCLELATPLIPSEHKSNSLTYDDLNTPVPVAFPHTNKTPLIKDYPQGPYSNSSVGTSYYMPSERSITESDDYSPSKLGTIWEKTLIQAPDSHAALDQDEAGVNIDEELNTTINLSGSVSDKSPNTKKSNVKKVKGDNAKQSPRKSSNVMSRKEMGEMIEREIFKTFLSQDSSSPSKEDNLTYQSDASNASFSGKLDGNSKDSSKGKQGKKRRVPSKKYQNIAESTCSEDEFDHRSDNSMFSNSLSDKNTIESPPASQLKTKKNIRRPGGRNYNGKDQLDKINDITTESQGKETISCSKNGTKNVNVRVKRSTNLNVKGKSLMKSKEELDLGDSHFNLRKATVIHPHAKQNQPSKKQNSSDLQESSCHLPNKKVSSHKDTLEESSDVDPNPLSNWFGFDTSSDSDSDSLEINTQNDATNTKKNKVKLMSKDIFGSDLSLNDSSDFETPTKKKKISESSESFSSKLSINDKETAEEEKESKVNLRRSQRSTRARGVVKYQAAPVVARGSRRGRGNVHQTAPRGRGRGRGRGKKNENINVIEVMIEAILENNTSSFPKKVLDDDAGSEEDTSKRDIGRRRLSVEEAEGRTNTSTDSNEEDKHSSDTQLKQTEECQVVYHQVTDRKVDSEASGLRQTLMKEPFSHWGGGMQTHKFNRVKNNTTSIDTLRMQWSKKTKQLGVSMDTNTPQGNKSVVKQSCLSITETHLTQKNDDSCVECEAEGEHSDLYHLQKGNNTTPLADEHITEQACASTSKAYLPQNKIKTMNARGKGSKKHPSTREGDQRPNTSLTLKPSQSQKKGGVCRNAKLQHCARTMIYEYTKQTGSLNQLEKMGTLGKIINISSKRRKVATMNRTNTLAEDEDTFHSTPELSSGKQKTFVTTPDLAEQTSTSEPTTQHTTTTITTSTTKPSLIKKNNTSENTSKHSMEQESNTNKNLPKPSVKRWNTKKHSTGDIIPSKHTLKPSTDNNSLSKSTLQPAAEQKIGSSKSEIQALSGDSKSSSTNVLTSKGKRDTLSSDQSKSSSSQLSSLALPKKNYGKPTAEAFNSEDTPTTLPSHHASPIPSVSTSPQPQKISEVLEESGKNNAKFSHQLPADQDTSHIDEGDDNSPPMSAEGFSDLEETSEEHCLMAYTVLPPTPEKKMGRICHTMVKEGKAMVAFPSPSKPHPSPKQTLPQGHSIQTKLKDRMNSQASSARRHLLMNTGNHSQDKCSVENKTKKSAQGKPKKGSNSQVCSSNVKLPQVDCEDSFKEETNDYDHLKGDQESSLDENSTIDQDDTQSKERYNPSKCSQGTSSEKTDTTFDITTHTNDSPGKQSLVNFKHFPVISQHSPETDQTQGSGQLREDSSEDKMEEEEDSDVLRIEEPSETENEDTEEVVCTLNLTLTELIDIFSINIKPQKQKPKKKKPTLPATKPKKQVRKIPPTTSKTEENLTPKKPPQHTPEKDKLKKKKRNTPITSQSHTHTHTPMEDHHHIEGENTITTTTDNDNDTNIQSSSMSSLKQPRLDNTPSRSYKRTGEGGCYAGRSKPTQNIEQNTSSTTKKPRRITPTRIGDLERHKMASKRSWWEPRTTKEFHWAQNRVNAAVHMEMMEGKGSSVTQIERLGKSQGSVSERSASSQSSLSPGCLLISESPRGPDSSPAPFTEFTAPGTHATLGSPLVTTAYTLTTPTKTDALTASSPPSSASKLSVNHVRAGKQPGATDTYIIETETSRELDEEQGLGKQRRVRHMARELHRGGNLEIARTPDKQLAVMMSHPHERGNVYMSEESFPSLSHTPPTPGKHLFIPPPPVLTAAFSSTSTSSSSSSTFSYSQAKQEHINLPLKKRKDLISIPDQVYTSKVTKTFNINKSFNSFHGSE